MARGKSIAKVGEDTAHLGSPTSFPRLESGVGKNGARDKISEFMNPSRAILTKETKVEQNILVVPSKTKPGVGHVYREKGSG